MRTDDDFPLHLATTLFNQLPGVAYFVKDATLRYVGANATMCDLCGAFESDVLGRRSSEFFSTANASRGEKAEQEILLSERPSSEALSRIVGINGHSNWILIRRWPLINQLGRAVGVVGLGRLLPGQARRTDVYSRVASALEHVHAKFRDALEVRSVAKAAGLSLDRLEKEFNFMFGLSPREYITKVRLESASERLLLGESIASVAQSCGYSDQSAFARRFRRQIGVSPSEFRHRRR